MPVGLIHDPRPDPLRIQARSVPVCSPWQVRSLGLLWGFEEAGEGDFEAGEPTLMEVTHVIEGAHPLRGHVMIGDEVAGGIEARPRGVAEAWIVGERDAGLVKDIADHDIFDADRFAVSGFAAFAHTGISLEPRGSCPCFEGLCDQLGERAGGEPVAATACVGRELCLVGGGRSGVWAELRSGGLEPLTMEIGIVVALEDAGMALVGGCPCERAE